MHEVFTKPGLTTSAIIRQSLLAFGVALFMATPTASNGGVLSEGDMRRVESLKPLFANLMNDLIQTTRRSDVANGDVACINSTIQELLQISEELASYEYLIAIDKEITGFDQNSPMHDLVKFAADKSSTILGSERKRLVQLSDQCARFPVASTKNQQVLQIIDSTTSILTAIRDHL